MKILNQVYQDLKQYYSDTDIKIRAEYDTQRNTKSVVIDSGINIVIQIYHGRLNVSTNTIINVLTDTVVNCMNLTETEELFIGNVLWCKVIDLTRLYKHENAPISELSGYWYDTPTTDKEENDLIDYLGFVNTLKDIKAWTNNIKTVLAVAHETGDLYIEDFQEFEEYRDML